MSHLCCVFLPSLSTLFPFHLLFYCPLILPHLILIKMWSTAARAVFTRYSSPAHSSGLQEENNLFDQLKRLSELSETEINGGPPGSSCWRSRRTWPSDRFNGALKRLWIETFTFRSVGVEQFTSWAHSLCFFKMSIKPSRMTNCKN